MYNFLALQPPTVYLSVCTVIQKKTHFKKARSTLVFERDEEAFISTVYSINTKSLQTSFESLYLLGGED